MSKTRILYVSQAIQPFLPESDISRAARQIPQGIHERGREIRVFMPRFGVINERRHQLRIGVVVRLREPDVGARRPAHARVPLPERRAAVLRTVQPLHTPKTLLLPHPRMHARSFVLVPLADIAPNWRHPVNGKTVRHMLEALPEADRNGVIPLVNQPEQH